MRFQTVYLARARKTMRAAALSRVFRALGVHCHSNAPRSELRALLKDYIGTLRKSKRAATRRSGRDLRTHVHVLVVTEQTDH